ncbi:MAG: DUF4351 domain-containing protein [Acidobacteriota bacterium]|nr:DUF4351 domain-containing protein [Acidobacteriota bacterium]
MHEYDIALKVALQGAAGTVLRELTGGTIHRWLNVELPEVRNMRVDLLGEASEGRLIHLELQSRNDPKMALRMVEYYVSVFRRYDRFPDQILLYVGEEPMRMQAELRESAHSFHFQYKLVDIRELDGDRLLESDQVGDNVIAILARLQDRQAAVRRIVEKIAALPEADRQGPLGQLVILAGLRHLEDTVEQEVSKMPITEDIRNHSLFRREYEQGVQQGVEQGVEQGVQRGEQTILRRQIEKRFGAIPKWAVDRLETCRPSQLEELATKLLDVSSLEELLP